MEAATAFGANRRQRLFNVQLPLAMPTIMAGINQTIMMALAMVVIASMIGVKGLGQPVLKSITNQYFTMGSVQRPGDRRHRHHVRPREPSLCQAVSETSGGHSRCLIPSSASKISTRSSVRRPGKSVMPMVHQGKSKDDILAETGHTVGLKEHQSGDPEGRDLRHHGLLRLRQVDPDPPFQPADRPDRGLHHRRRHRCHAPVASRNWKTSAVTRCRWCSSASACCPIGR